MNDRYRMPHWLLYCRRQLLVGQSWIPSKRFLLGQCWKIRILKTQSTKNWVRCFTWLSSNLFHWRVRKSYYWSWWSLRFCSRRCWIISSDQATCWRSHRIGSPIARCPLCRSRLFHSAKRCRQKSASRWVEMQRGFQRIDCLRCFRYYQLRSLKTPSSQTHPGA